MNKALVIIMMVSSLFLTACDKFKQKKEETAQTANTEWSCTNDNHIEGLQLFLKSEYLKKLDRSLRDSDYYTSDEALLKTINENLKFDIKNIRTVTQDITKTSQLECEGELVVNFPKGLQKRAENAFLEQRNDCEEGCDRDDEIAYRTLNDYLENREVPLIISSDLVKGHFKFDVLKTDKEGITVNAQHQNEVLDAVVLVAVKAVQYEAYVKENEVNRERQTKNSVEDAAQTELALKAMNIRKKEIDADKLKVVDRLNQTWDRFNDEQKAQLKQDQADWFEKRDVDCKVISQKGIHDISESELEIYQKQSGYWDESMYSQNKEMQYDKCFTQRTNERIVYLNNVFN